MDQTKKLIVPEINATSLTKEDKIIANPNCSTIQMVLALAPLHKKYKIKRIVVSTYQSITGTGVKAVRQLDNEYAGIKSEMAYKYPIHRNVIPQCDVFEENGYTKEEFRLLAVTAKRLMLNLKMISTYLKFVDYFTIQTELRFKIILTPLPTRCQCMRKEKMQFLWVV